MNRTHIFLAIALAAACGCVRLPFTGDPNADRPILVVDSARIRSIATRAIRQQFPDTDLEEFNPGYIIYTEAAAGAPAPQILVEWVGREAITVEKGESPDLDRKKVRKLQVRMRRDGQVEEVLDTSTWLYRRLDE